MDTVAVKVEPIKAEPIEVSLETQHPDDDIVSIKKRKLSVAVVVPTLREVNVRKKATKLEVKQEATVKGTQGTDTKANGLKVKKNPREFNLDTINRRLEALGPDRNYEVNVPDEIKCTAVPRAFLSNTWGGSTQATFPKIRKEMLDKHGLNDWMFPNSEYNPHCPLVPGFAGIMFTPDGLNGPEPDSPAVWRTIVRLVNGAFWAYVGQYIRIGAQSLTKEEWLEQTPKVRNTWAKELWRKGWGRNVRVRVTLRQQLGREPTKRELDAASGDLDNKYQDISAEDIREAYDCGEELLGVRLLKCVGYDEAFQREVHEKFQTWVPRPEQEKKDTKKKGTKATSKRRGTANVQAQNSTQANMNKPGGLVYVPKGTKSRPKI